MVRPEPPAVVTVGAPVERSLADTAAVTFALLRVDQEGAQQIRLRTDFQSTTSDPQFELRQSSDSRPALVVSAPAFRVPSASSVARTLRRDALADILANSVDTRIASPLPNTPVSWSSLDAPAQRGLLDLSRSDSGPQSDRFYDLESLDEPPDPLNAAVARYPALLASQGVEGFVDVRFAIESSGQTDSIQILSSTDGRFEQPVIKAIQRSRYRPGHIAGVAVRTMVVQRFAFHGASGELAKQSVLQAATSNDLITVDQSLIYNPIDVDVLPEPITSAVPRYPQVLWDRGVNGYVDIEFVIGLSGMAERSSITVTSSSDRRFEQPATEAIRLSVYRPALIRSIPVRVLVQQRVTFSKRR